MLKKLCIYALSTFLPMPWLSVQAHFNMTQRAWTWLQHGFVCFLLQLRLKARSLMDPNLQMVSVQVRHITGVFCTCLSILWRSFITVQTIWWGRESDMGVFWMFTCDNHVTDEFGWNLWTFGLIVRKTFDEFNTSAAQCNQPSIKLRGTADLSICSQTFRPHVWYNLVHKAQY